ncbi:hypothetical protein EDB82DRAFT_561069 [Fusarium venenatum]|uniref:uncharacterized protein n=1 Tax=Fusarium venenatum TaxID=56646 RepID=UPI001D9524A4|nr:hypothetical protein EDB82DRAFT_561069 [Fusarium venenatum]
MYFSKISTVLAALAVSVPDVVATPSSNLDARQVPKVYPIMKPVPKGPPIQDTQAKNPGKGAQPITKPDTNTPVTQQPQGYKGFASYIYQGEYAGKCGQVSRDSDFVVTLDKCRFDMSLCGKKIRVDNAAQRWIEVTVVGSTDGGIDENFLDLSVGAFKAISRIENGIEPVTWNYI